MACGRSSVASRGSPTPWRLSSGCCSATFFGLRGAAEKAVDGSSAPMRPISGFSSCAARSRMHNALAALLVASPGSGPPGSPNLSSRFSAPPLGSSVAAPAAQRAQWAGTGMVLVSATAFGTLAIFAKLGYASGLGTGQDLAFRFLLAAIGMIALAHVLGQNPVRLRRNQLLTLFGLGAIVYTGQSLTYFIALRSLPASLVVLIAYIYPSLVVVAGWLFLRRAVSAWHGIALVMSFLGVALLVGGAQFHLSWTLAMPLVLAIASPTIYTGYILIGERVMTSVPAVAASAVIMSGAALAFCLLAAFTHELALPRNAGGWAVGVGIALVPTMVAISLFLAGLPRIGAARAALLSTWEPVVTVLLAVVILGDRLSIVQVIGGVLVLLAVIVVQASHLWRPGLPNALK